MFTFKRALLTCFAIETTTTTTRAAAAAAAAATNYIIWYCSSSFLDAVSCHGVAHTTYRRRIRASAKRVKGRPTNKWWSLAKHDFSKKQDESHIGSCYYCGITNRALEMLHRVLYFFSFHLAYSLGRLPFLTLFILFSCFPFSLVFFFLSFLSLSLVASYT